MALKDIKIKIQATERTHKVTRAMEAVSAVKMRKTQSFAFAGRPYARAALAVLTRVAGTSELKQHPLTIVRKEQKIAIIIMTSDKGLAGALNSGVIKEAQQMIKNLGYGINDVEKISVYAYGRKGEEFFRRRGYSIVNSHENRSDEIEISKVEKLSQIIIDGFINGDYDKVFAFYSNFKSTFEQFPTMRQLLPLSISALTEIVEGIVPSKGKWSEKISVDSPRVYTIEPEGGDFLNKLIPKLVTVAIYNMLLEAKASEHSARMVAMKSASDKSKELARDLTRRYNKIRQAAITREVSEIVGGREALEI